MSETRPRVSKLALAFCLGSVLLAIAVVVSSMDFSFRSRDTLLRRRSTADTIRRLVSQYENNPENKAPLNEIIEYAKGDYGFARTYAVVALGDLDKPAKAAVPVLAHALQGSDQYTAREAARALGRYGPFAYEAIPALIRALEDWEGSDVSWFAAEALGKIGIADPKVIRALEKAQTSQDPFLRENATEAVEALRGVSTSGDKDDRQAG